MWQAPCCARDIGRWAGRHDGWTGTRGLVAGGRAKLDGHILTDDHCISTIAPARSGHGTRWAFSPFARKRIMPVKSKLKPKLKATPKAKPPAKSKPTTKKPAKAASKTQDRKKIGPNPHTGRHEALPEKGTWRDLILHIIQKRINWKAFTFDEVHAFKKELKARKPKNKHIEDKIYQVLQDLRAEEIIAFTKDGGRYLLLKKLRASTHPRRQGKTKNPTPTTDGKSTVANLDPLTTSVASIAANVEAVILKINEPKGKDGRGGKRTRTSERGETTKYQEEALLRAQQQAKVDGIPLKSFIKMCHLGTAKLGMPEQTAFDRLKTHLTPKNWVAGKGKGKYPAWNRLVSRVKKQMATQKAKGKDANYSFAN